MHLASVDGFRITVLLTFEHLFGLRRCQDCPDCYHGNDPCHALFGRNAAAEGGISGIIYAVYVYIEAQKSTGRFHAHCQLFLQRVHQHTGLLVMLAVLQTYSSGIIREHVDYIDARPQTSLSHWRPIIRSAAFIV